MDKKLVSKIQTVSFLGAAVLGWVVTGVLIRALAGIFGSVQRLYGQDLFQHGLPISVAIIVFLYLQLNPKINAWAEIVILEVSKVVWPTQKDTVGMTIVTLIMLAISCAVLVTFDWAAASVIGFIMDLKFS